MGVEVRDLAVWCSRLGGLVHSRSEARRVEAPRMGGASSSRSSQLGVSQPPVSSCATYSSPRSTCNWALSALVTGYGRVPDSHMTAASSG